MQFSAKLDLRVAIMDCKLQSQPCTAIWASPFPSHMSITGSCFANFGIRTGQGLGLFSGRDYVGQEVNIGSLHRLDRFHLKTRAMRMAKSITIIENLDFQSGRGRAFTVKKRDDSSRGKVVNQSSSQESIAMPSEEELKDRLEALHEEALHVRDRCNNARSRFVRLTEAAQQLRRRAGFDMDTGNEDSARSLLVEKQKVLRAAELSKRRAKLLEELSYKLGEAISKVETQLVFVLSSSHSPKEEPVVRAVAPRDEDLTSIDPDLVDTREEIAITKENPIEVADGTLEEVSKIMRGEEREGKEPFSAADCVPVEKRKPTETDHTHSTFRDLYSREMELEATVRGVFLDEGNLPEEMKELNDSAGKLNSDLQSRQSLISTPLTGPDGVVKSGSNSGHLDSSSGITDFAEDMPSATSSTTIGKDDTSTDTNDANLRSADEENEQWHEKARQDIVDSPSTESESVPSREDILYEEEMSTFEKYLEDIDCDVAAVESKLTVFMAATLSGNQNTIAEKIKIVGELLNQVRSLRNRISEVAMEYRGENTAGIRDSHVMWKNVNVSK